jgi:peptidyl-prolyl cis-trans isomerase D
MLQSFRKAAKSWFAKGLMLTLAAAFGLWGINDIFRGGTIDTSVATVGGHKIPVEDFDRELRAEMRNQGQRLHTEITLEQAHNSGLSQVVIDRMITRTVLDGEAQKLGLTASNAAIVSEIRSMPQFQGNGGTFSRALLDEALQQARMNEDSFESGVRQDFARAQLIDSVISWFGAPTGLTHLLIDYIGQRRTAEYVVITPDLAGSVRAPTDAELAAYHKQNAARFSTPEYRELEYVEIGTEQFAGDVKVTDDDLKQEYDEHKDLYVKPELRDIDQINFPTQAAADTAQKKIASGTSFLQLAHDMGLKDADLKLGNFAKSGLSPALADAAFAVPEGGVTPPVQGPFGWVILHVSKVTPGINKTFDELKDSLRQQVAKAKATELAIDAANKFEDARAGGASLEQAASKLGLTAVHVAAVDRAGLTPGGTKADVPAPAVFLQQAFAAEAGDEGDLFQSDDQHSFAIKVIGITPPALRPLDTVRAEVVKDWTEAERAKLLAARTKSLAEQAQKDGDLAAIAKTLGRTVATSEPLQRAKPTDVFSQAVLADLFKAPPGKVVSGPIGKGEGFVIARVTKVQNPDPTTAASEFEQGDKEISREISSDIVLSMANSARATQGTTINQAELDRYFGGSNE